VRTPPPTKHCAWRIGTSGALKQFYLTPFSDSSTTASALCAVHHESRVPNFSLDIQFKQPYKGDTTALSSRERVLDVKGESLDEERNQEESGRQEEGARQEEGCCEEKEVATFSSNHPAPSNRGRFFFAPPFNL
jgi:hypothetical protein